MYFYSYLFLLCSYATTIVWEATSKCIAFFRISSFRLETFFFVQEKKPRVFSVLLYHTFPCGNLTDVKKSILMFIVAFTLCKITLEVCVRYVCFHRLRTWSTYKWGASWFSIASEDFKQSSEIHIANCVTAYKFIFSINLFKFFRNLILLIRRNATDSSTLHIINQACMRQLLFSLDEQKIILK